MSTRKTLNIAPRSTANGSAPSAKAFPPRPFIKYYLSAYNILSALGWSSVLVLTLYHLATSPLTPTGAPESASSTFSRVFSRLPYFSSTTPPPILQLSIQEYIKARLPDALVPLWERSKTTYGVVGTQVALVQTLAVVEVLNVALGWVRSGLGTTLMQVASRLTLVWGIVERFPETRTNPLYTSMVLSWSLTEVIRYTFYAHSLLSPDPSPSSSKFAYLLTYLRYTTFLVLYPTGASSEAFLVYSTLPTSPLFPGNWYQKYFAARWSSEDVVRGVSFLIWWPGLYVMYTHMIRQRSKVIGGGGRTVGGSNKEKSAKKTK